MDYEIVKATEDDRKEIMALYKMQLGREFCPWDVGYPSDETIDFDLSRDALFVLKSDGIIKAAVSIEKDEDVEKLECWDEKLKPSGELARLAVHPDEQNKGLARIMLKFGMEELRKRGFKGIHFLVNKLNIKAIRSYEVFGFNVVGESRIFSVTRRVFEKIQLIIIQKCLN
jgi:ribosomal protein S18 acetylase RimI-like enzyme